MMADTYSRVLDEAVEEWGYRLANFLYQRGKRLSNSHCQQQHGSFEFSTHYRHIFIPAREEEIQKAHEAETAERTQKELLREVMTDMLAPISTDLAAMRDRITQIESKLGQGRAI